MKPASIVRITSYVALLTVPLVSCRGPAEPEQIVVTVDVSELTLIPCDSRRLTARVDHVSDTGVEWRTEEAGIVRVLQDGTLTAVKPGSTTIIAVARADTSKRATVDVQVRADLQKVTVTGGRGDTIGAYLPEPVTAVATWAPGCPAADHVLRFSSATVRAGEHEEQQPAVRLGLPGTEPAEQTIQVVTDSTGAADVAVRLGMKSGSHAVTARDLSATMTGSTTFTISPGSAYRADASPRDTAIYVGASYGLRGVMVVDRGWNRLYTPSSDFLADTAGILSLAGYTVTADAPGRARILHAGVVVASVSVVPRGTLALSRIVEHSGVDPAVILLELDGSTIRTVYESSRTGFNVRTTPRWHPDASRFVLLDAVAGTISTGPFVSDTLGNASVLLADETEIADAAAFSADGEWIYFRYGSDGLYRIRSTGEGSRELIAGIDIDGTTNITEPSSPSSSPDGRYLVLHNSRGRLIQMDVEARTSSPLGIAGLYPAWSPDGGTIAYLAEGVVWLANADGTNPRPLTADARSNYGDGLTWSPDGQWLATRSRQTTQIHLLHVTTGVVLPLAFTGQLADPDWRPLIH